MLKNPVIVAPRALLVGLLSALLAAPMAGCVAGPELKTPYAAAANPYLAVNALHTYPHKQGLLVYGQVQASRSRALPVNGLLHITGTFADGTPPVAVETRWGTMPVMGSRRATFSALIPTDHPELITKVAVELRAAPALAGL